MNVLDLEDAPVFLPGAIRKQAHRSYMLCKFCIAHMSIDRAIMHIALYAFILTHVTGWSKGA